MAHPAEHGLCARLLLWKGFRRENRPGPVPFLGPWVPEGINMSILVTFFLKHSVLLRLLSHCCVRCVSLERLPPLTMASAARLQ